MSKCIIEGCKKNTQYKNTKQVYCIMHLARVRRHGYPELKKDAFQSLEKLPHKTVDDFITENCKKMDDIKIAERLQKLGFRGATKWTVGYRRRKLGNRKYLRGEIQKHKAWVRAQAVKKYGDACELCGYKMAIDTHHIIPKHKGGLHEIENLMVVCPNCHALITRKIVIISDRKEIPKIRFKIRKKIKSLYRA